MLRFLLILTLLPTAVLAELQVSDAWIKHLPASVPVRAGYLTLHNPGSESVTIQSAQSLTFANIEFHTTVEQDGMMQMQQLPQLVIEANSSVQLSPGGLHLMMMGPVNETAPGDLVTITLKFVDGAEQTLRMIVKE